MSSTIQQCKMQDIICRVIEIKFKKQDVPKMVRCELILKDKDDWSNTEAGLKWSRRHHTKKW
ncbi:PxORF102 peptide [Plutella xylostella granulovirus]|uniref:ORF100 protein n=1 Tax=Plutella xylostella granulovirus TaxID=98383 RepID=Q9DVT1_9BBAC|nr:PxORF102 peptide [Plutella xylostella granulovirus]AAG27400.1 PxORF102 peptide [Plutella xylostella granulovirus]AMQ35712.1 PxGV-Corf100 protein [Plutella xylostella granulovirus]AMQ35829.1 PxGV-Korf100 protein [Plutella xylostella granulovirus]AMQ35946.1 PxGV-Morf100 protein [Plutella xylostella granulovirus]AMQ36063.1 PxGV-Torf100 protein [Plutella xylostella granulovirus]